MREGGRGRRKERMEGVLMCSNERQIILAELAREEMTEGRHIGRLGV